MNAKTAAVSLLAACFAAVAFGQLRERPAPSRPGAYRVTAWPDHKSTEQDYSEEVEAHLNKLAAEGWRFHSEMTGQFGRMMVFERASEK